MVSDARPAESLLRALLILPEDKLLLPYTLPLGGVAVRKGTPRLHDEVRAEIRDDLLKLPDVLGAGGAEEYDEDEQSHGYPLICAGAVARLSPKPFEGQRSGCSTQLARH